MGRSQGLALSRSQGAASCQQIPLSAETHLLHMSILPLNPSKGFPESTSVSAGHTSLMSWSYVFSRHWSRYPVVLSRHAFDPNVCLKLYRELVAQLSDASWCVRKERINVAIRSFLDPISHLWSVNELHFLALYINHSLCKEALASRFGSSPHSRASATNLIKSPWRSVSSA